MRFLIVDNYDSFTNNIAEYLRLLGEDIHLTLVKNDAWWIFDDPAYAEFDSFILSPGPGNPGNPHDVGIGTRILADESRPILGICLGHQALVHAEGGRVVRAPEPVHGRTSPVIHDGSTLFAGLPQTIDAMRYHSWIAVEPLPDTLRVTARTGALVMAVEHVRLPRWGVQFHPESIGTSAGLQILGNFLRESRRQAAARHEALRRGAAATRPAARLHWRELGTAVSPARLTEVVRRAGGAGLLLESAMVQPGLSGFSYIAAPLACDDRNLVYRQAEQITEISDPNGTTERRRERIFDVLRMLERPIHYPMGRPPFDFHGGAVGWFGYELKSDCSGLPVRDPGHADAAFQLVHRFLVVDHAENRTYAAFCETSTPGIPAFRKDAVEAAFAELAAYFAEAVETRASPAATPSDREPGQPVEFVPRHDDSAYLDLVRTCRDQIVEGESYELCLTNRISTRTPVDPWALYRVLRERNAAPYAAFLPIADLTIVSSSPECFLKITGDRRVIARPIKGTIRRSSDPLEDRQLRALLAGSEKDRAENLMIVDLLRHDLTIVAESGSVSVPSLNAIESYETVHQMVSTVEARLRPGLSPVDAIVASFPGGSMTGAPKVRTMEILDRLEDGPRGVYSGALGWLGYDGQADLSIVIRTAVFHDGNLTIGSGGAITILSEAEAELEEMKLKARALMRAVAETATGDPDNYRYRSEPTPPDAKTGIDRTASRIAV